MAELERRREAIRQREEAERLEAEKKRAAEEAERKRLARVSARFRGSILLAFDLENLYTFMTFVSL